MIIIQFFSFNSIHYGFYMLFFGFLLINFVVYIFNAYTYTVKTDNIQTKMLNHLTTKQGSPNISSKGPDVDFFEPPRAKAKSVL